MKIVSSNIKKILSLMIAVAIIITSFNTSNIEAKASEDGNNAKSNTTSLSSDKWKLKPDGIQIGTWEDTWKFDPSTDPETYGWDRELCKEMFLNPCFAHHSVGYTFKSSSGINYRVTKEGGYHKLGHVEIIGYEPDQVNERTAENWMEEAEKNQPDQLISKPFYWESFNHAYGCDLWSSRPGISASERKQHKKSGQKAKDNMRVVRIKTDAYADQIVTDTYNPGAGGDSRHEWFLVTSIAPGAFKNNKQLEYVYIPETVLTIPKDCFKGCSNLKEVEWGSYILKCVKNDETLKNSAFPKYNAKKRICQGAFANCNKLELIYLGPIYAEIKVEKKAFDKDKKTIKVLGTKNRYLKKFAQNIKVIGNSKKEAKAVKEKETY